MYTPLYIFLHTDREVLVVQNESQEALRYYKAMTTIGYLAHDTIRTRYFQGYSNYAALMVQVAFAINLAPEERLDAFSILHTQCASEKQRNNRTAGEDQWEHTKCKIAPFKTSQGVTLNGACAEEDLDGMYLCACVWESAGV
jgi:hypothetical protein